MIRRFVHGAGVTGFYVYKRGPIRIKVKLPGLWERTFFRKGPDNAPSWETDDGMWTPTISMSLELELLHEESGRAV